MVVIELALDNSSGSLVFLTSSSFIPVVKLKSSTARIFFMFSIICCFWSLWVSKTNEFGFNLFGWLTALFVRLKFSKFSTLNNKELTLWKWNSIRTFQNCELIAYIIASITRWQRRTWRRCSCMWSASFRPFMNEIHFLSTCSTLIVRITSFFWPFLTMLGITFIWRTRHCQSNTWYIQRWVIINNTLLIHPVIKL